MCECLLFAIYLSSRLWRFIHIHLLGIIRFLSYLFSPDDVSIFAIISVNEWTLEQTVNVYIYRVRRLGACSHLVSLSANRCVVFLVSFILFPLRIITRIVRRLRIYAVNRNRKRRYTLKERMTERNMNELQSVFFSQWFGTVQIDNIIDNEIMLTEKKSLAINSDANANDNRWFRFSDIIHK